MSASKPHSMSEQLRILWLTEDDTALWMRLPEIIQHVMRLEEQVQSLELACDHHKMFWQKAEERERRLKEQLEALRVAMAEIHAETHESSTRRLAWKALNPASERDA